MRTVGPEVGDRGTNGSVAIRGVSVHVAGVRDLALGCRVDAVDLGAGEGAQVGDLELLGQGIDTSVLQELIAALVDLRDRGIGFEGTLAGNLPGEIVASIQELEEAADSVNVFGCELQLTRLHVRDSKVSLSHRPIVVGVSVLTLPSSVNASDCALK